MIGLVGSTGNASAPHLHFEIRLGGPNGQKIDPYPNTAVRRLLGDARSGYLNQMRWYSRLSGCTSSATSATSNISVRISGKPRTSLRAKIRSTRPDDGARPGRADVAPALLVGDAVAGGGHEHAGEHEREEEKPRTVEHGVDVEQHGGDVQRLRLELVDELPVVHGSILAGLRRAGLGTAAPECGADRTRRRCRRRGCGESCVCTPKRPDASAKARSRTWRRRATGESGGRVEGDEVHVGTARRPGQAVSSRPERVGLVRAGRSRPAIAAYSKLTRRPWAPATSAAASSTSAIG